MPQETNYSREDRDLLIELRTEMLGMRLDIKELKEGTATKLADHETRLRFIERYMWLAIGALGVIQFIIGYLK